MSKLIVVAGVTGAQGSSVAEVFVGKPGWKVRGVTRNASKAADWTARGVEVVEVDLDDEASWMRALEGAYAAFETTDFWGPVFDPATKSKLAHGQQINEYAFQLEQQRIKTMADAAAKTKGLQRFILSALSNASERTQGRLTNVYHFDSKALGAEYVRTHLPGLAAKMSVIHIGSYMDNWGKGIRPRKQPDGTWRISLVGEGDTKVPHFFTRKDTGSLVQALLEVAPGVTVSAAGSMLSWKECLQVWCETQNVPYGGYDEVPPDVFASRWPIGPVIGLEFAEMFLYMDDPGYEGGDPSVILPQDLGVSCSLTSFKEWCKQTDFSAILNQ